VVCNSSEGYTGKFDPTIDVYVVNKAVGYGGKRYSVSVKAQPDLMSTHIGLDEFKEKTVPYDKSEYINRLSHISDIETSGDYARGWTSNASVIDDLKQQAVDLQYTNVNVYLHVISNGTTGYYIKGWHWVEKNGGSASRLIEYVSVDDILTRGVLGPDYSQKVKAICSADYTKAQSVGYANLCQDLGKRLKTDVLKGAPSSIKTREEAIKNIIDGLHAKYDMYRTPVGIKKTCFITPCKGMFG
jgi:hypothetical protein